MELLTQQVSFDSLARDLAPALRRYLRRYTGDASIADDLLQESLVRIARALPAFDGRSTVKTWAFAIATHVAADHFRKSERRIPIIDLGEASEVPDPECNLDDRAIVDEMSACVRQVIDGLPDDYRAALVLHDLEGESIEQTAAICGCSLATAKIRIHRARQRLRSALQQQCQFYRSADDVLRCDRKTND